MPSHFDDDQTIWMSRDEVLAIAPGLNRSKLDVLTREGKGAPARVLSDGDVLYDELLYRRWLESTRDDQWVHGVWGDTTAETATRERSYDYSDARLDELRRRTYITPQQLLRLLPDLASWQMHEMRNAGVGPRFLRPTPSTIIYVAEEARWWFGTAPNYAPRLERGVDRRSKRRPLLTPPVAVRRPLTPIEEARLRGNEP